MKLLIVRHGEPDYVHDALTKQGRKEAMLLAAYLSGVQIDHAYVSPLGRAQLTAAPTLEAKHMGATTLDWLREFPALVRHSGHGLMPGCAWDWLPADWTSRPAFYGERWYEEPEFAHALGGTSVGAVYQGICASFDELLAAHGYRRQGKTYEVTRANHDTVALFCHFGLECVLLSHLLSVSPMPLWHGFCAAPSSITTVYTEERKRGVASWRIAEFGATPHLALGHVDPSFAARFCECHDDKTQH